MVDLNIAGDSHAHSLLAAGHVDKTEGGWSFTAEDGNKLLGPKGDNWTAYSQAHLGLNRDAKDKTKARYKYPVIKGGTLYRSGVVAAKQRAAQQNDSAVEAAAGALLAAIDKVKGIDDIAIAAVLDMPLKEVKLDDDGGEQLVLEAPVKEDAMPIESVAPVPASCRSFVSLDDLRIAMCSDKGPQPGTAVRASFDTKVKAVEGQRALNFTISTPNVDRMGDTIAIDGWQLENYRKNPVVLWAHDSGQPPVAKAIRLLAEEGSLKSTALFVDAAVPGGIGAFAEGVYQLYKQGFLNATSVGFAPIEFSFTDDPERGLGINFMKQELLEFSCVPIPANAEALIEGRSVIPTKSYHAILDWIESSLRTNKERAVKFAESILGCDGTDLFLRDHAIRVLAATDEFYSPSLKKEMIALRSFKDAADRKAAYLKRRAARARDLEILRLRSKDVS